VKVRIGVGVGATALPTGGLGTLVDELDGRGFDSLWLSEVLTAPVLDPLVGLAWAAARSPKLKLGTTMLLPGRNIVRLAKELASLDLLSEGRLLVTFVPGLTHPPERDAIGVPPSRRSAAIDEVIPLLRRLWAGETVSHTGDTGSFEAVTLAPLPVQKPLELWLGGMTPSALERCGRLSDGWLPALCTPGEAADGRRVIDRVAAEAGRAISAEHFGVSIGYTRTPLDEAAVRVLATRSRGHDPVEMVPVGLAALRRLIERFLAVGFSKFVVRPMGTVASWPAELDELYAAVGDLQT
jgi:probable F420-dependent oxidoreductase